MTVRVVGSLKVPADPLNAGCRRDFKACRSSGRRAVAQIGLIVLHDEEASSARAAAAWFANESALGSAHLCVDDRECYRTLPNTAVAWGAPGANTQGFHIEQAGFARWSAVVWRSHLGTLRRAAFKTAYHCRLFGIPPRFVKAAGLRAGLRGVTTHAECSKAFGGDHRDPGVGWPRPLFMALVRKYHRELEGGNL